ncbi:hypothetical protein GCM10009795_004240 [Nocardioides hankookensis]|uniref:PknH-like extracellular domain-containing protein n=1 Tax=Nocardioides hankookensis TaxID=443157 RepID=A0ABW1LMQ6_9ACTN
MHRRWLNRALIALVAPALIVPAVSSSATAAATAQVPSIGAVAKIYPHLEGGTANESAAKVLGPGKKCKTGKPIKGASQRTASYSPDYTSGDPDAYLITGARPSVFATAMKFPSTKAAIAYLHGYASYSKDCPGGAGGGTGGGGTGGMKCKSSMKKIKFNLGNERWGYQTKSTCTMAGVTSTSVFNSLFARQGKFIVYTGAMSMDATAPSIPASISMTKLALKTVA